MSAFKIFSGIAVLALGILAVGSTSDAQDPAPVVTHNAVMKTSLGNIEIELYGMNAPKTVKNFIELSKKQYYNGILFHRVVPGFVVQAGDPYTRDSAGRREIWGQGGRSVFGNTFADELHPDMLRLVGYKEGVLAMANRGPNTNSSQFFIVLSEAGATHLTAQYKWTIFGRVTKGMDIVHKMEKATIDARTGQPQQPASIMEIDAIEVKAANN
ncbi:MAG: peptidylprolyl isomerase [bacterium]|nr:peptidylprolyl isomerase [Candidatus Kapabacteria bacterium]